MARPGLGRGRGDRRAPPSSARTVQPIQAGRVLAVLAQGAAGRAHEQSPGPQLPSWWLVPGRAAMAGEAGEGSAGVCSGRNRASIDLLLLKPKLLSGTLQPGCPRTRFLERTAPRAPAWGDSPPKHLDQVLAHARVGRQPGPRRPQGISSVPDTCGSAAQQLPAPADPSPLGLPGTPGAAAAGAGAAEGTVALAGLKRVYWRSKVIASSGDESPLSGILPGGFSVGAWDFHTQRPRALLAVRVPPSCTTAPGVPVPPSAAAAGVRADTGQDGPCPRWGARSHTASQGPQEPAFPGCPHPRSAHPGAPHSCPSREQDPVRPWTRRGHL